MQIYDLRIITPTNIQHTNSNNKKIDVGQIIGIAQKI